ncbi:MAG: aldose epimerase [Gammaproteobacteria bacterium]|jgi:galactose mutarotase-like enzyme
MIKRSIINNFKVYTIISPDDQTKASFVPEKGGVGCSIIMPWQSKPRELLYLHDNFWENDKLDLAGGWPFLFPICGRLDASGGYNLPIHGFAPYMSWEVLSSSHLSQLSMQLTATKETLKIYSYKFKLQLTYKVENNKLICEQIYTNMSDEPMPYYAGFHPYFLTPDKQNTILNFQPIKRLKYNEKLTEIIGEQKSLEFPTSIANPEINEQLHEIEENSLITLQYPDGFKLSMQAFDENHLFRYLQLYTMKDKPFFCIEPWMSYPGALNTNAARVLLPGCSETSKLVLRGDPQRNYN